MRSTAMAPCLCLRWAIPFLLQMKFCTFHDKFIWFCNLYVSFNSFIWCCLGSYMYLLTLLFGAVLFKHTGVYHVYACTLPLLSLCISRIVVAFWSLSATLPFLKVSESCGHLFIFINIPPWSISTGWWKEEQGFWAESLLFGEVIPWSQDTLLWRWSFSILHSLWMWRSWMPHGGIFF